MKELLGLLVLSWPLAIGGLLFTLVLLLAIAAFTISKGKGRRWGMAIAVLLGGFIIIGWDDLLGSAYLEHLCETEAGVKIFKATHLPSDYWNERGEPRFVKPLGNIDLKVLGERFDWKTTSERVPALGVHVERVTSRLVDKANYETLAEKITFSRRYGWAHSATSLAPNVGESCADLIAQRHGREEMIRQDQKDYATLVRSVFLRSTTR